MFSSEFCQISKNTFSHGTTLVAASVILRQNNKIALSRVIFMI